MILPVSDREVAARFYGGVLEVAGERVSPGRHYFDCEGVILACYDPAADADPLGDGWRQHASQYLYFAISDLVAARRRVEAAGGREVTEIAGMPWGERMFYALDPLGNRISFVDEATLFTGSTRV